ncbi:MAG TPA: hypothetical protein ENI24_04460 [Methylophaga sp.]|nr:hypothetical protein [Methylophaga sp.]
MKFIAETFISFCELAEAEGRLLKRKMVETTGVIMLMLVGVVLLATAIALALTAVHYIFATWFTMPVAFFATSLVCLSIAGGVLWSAMRLYNKV